MKKYLSLLLLGGLLILVVAQCKKKKEPLPDQVPTKYTVSYQLELTGDYTDLKIEYYQTGNSRQENIEINPKTRIK